MSDAWPIGRDHPETSRAAADATRAQYASERDRILAWVCDHGANGFTTAEVADALGIVRNQTAISVQWLRNHGFVDRVRCGYVADGSVEPDCMFDKRHDCWWQTRPTGAKTRGIVHVVTDAGHREYGRVRMDAARRG